MSQHELAELAGVKGGGQAVSRWERGLSTPRNFDQLAAALQMPLSELMSDLEVPSPALARKLNLGFEGPYESDRLARIEAELSRLSTSVEALVAAVQEIVRLRALQSAGEARRRSEQRTRGRGRPPEA